MIMGTYRAATEGAAQHEATHTPTSALTVTPTQTPTPTPTPIPVPPTASIEVKGLYLTTGTVGTPSKLQHYVDLANKTEINAYVIDIKDDYGEICYETQVPLAVKHGAWKKKYDVHAVINTFHENNIKVIGRIVCFSDPLMPLKEPDLSLKNASGSVFKVPLDNSHLAWLILKSRCMAVPDRHLEGGSILGFDELQYDYIRFPNHKLQI